MDDLSLVALLIFVIIIGVAKTKADMDKWDRERRRK